MRISTWWPTARSAPRGDGPRLRQPELHAGRRREAARRARQSERARGRARRCARRASARATRRLRSRSAIITSITPRRPRSRSSPRAARRIPKCRPTRTSRPTSEGRLCRAAGHASSGARKVDDVIATLSDGGLRGLGGAGFPTGRKWSLVRAEKGPRADGRQRRRGRARHLQGPHLSRERSRTSSSKAC